MIKKVIKVFKKTENPEIALKQWLSQLKNLPDPKGRVLITAMRNATWLEWAVYFSAVARQYGYECTILFKSSENEKILNNSKGKNFWKLVTEIPGVELLDIERLNYLEKDYELYYSIGKEKCIAALAYNHHIESQDIHDKIEIYKHELEKLRKEAAINGARIKDYLLHKKFHQFICYSGLIWDTHAMLAAAIDVRQSVVCVEGWAWREGHMIYNFNAPALEYNVKGWMNYFGKWDDKKNKEMAGYFSFLNGEEQNEEWLKSFHNVQKAKISEELPLQIAEFIKGDKKVFLLACNVIGDSSLLNRETIFRSHRDFVEQTISFFATRPDLKLIVRAHPAEEWVTSKVVIKMGELATKMVKTNKNILVINSSEKINTFSLLPYTHVGLVWITSAGVDMVVRGVPVIAAANPKYSGMGIVNEPSSAEEFFQLIDKYSKTVDKPTLEQIQKAKEYLYLVFKGFSFEAQGRNFRATTCKLNNMPSQVEHDRFYRILLRLDPAPDASN